MSRFGNRIRGHGSNPVHGIVVPDANWSGTPGSGAAAPALDTALKGSGFLCHPTANMLEVPGTWIGYDGLGGGAPHPITVHADTSDPAGIKEVRVYLEGGSVILRNVAWNPVHRNFGYVFTPYAPMRCAGEAQVVIDVVPVNGFIRRLGPYTLTLNTNGLIVRPEVYVCSASGTDDLASGRGASSGNPWKTVNYALQQCKDATALKGAIVRVLPGVQQETANPLGANRNKNTRQVAVAAQIGHGTGDTSLVWHDPAGGDPRYYASSTAGSNVSPGCFELAAQLVQLSRLTIDLGTIYQWYPNGTGTHWDFHLCALVDANGPAGVSDTNPAWGTAWNTGGAQITASGPMLGFGYWAIAQIYFRNNEGGYVYVTESTSEHYVLTGMRGVRNVTHRGSFDVFFLASGKLTDPTTGRVYTPGDDSWASNYQVSLASSYPTRITAADHLTIASAAYNGLNTILTVAEDVGLIGVGTPGNTAASRNITSRNTSQQFQAYKWLTGANIGRSSGGAGFEASSIDEGNYNGGAHVKYQYGFTPSGTAVSAAGATFTNRTMTALDPSAHLLEKGVPVVFYTTGTLPAGLSAGVTYWVSAAGLTATAFQVADTQAHALAGTNSVVTTDAGSGTMTWESRCIVVNGDFSTATGGSRVGDLIRGYITAHADPLQYSAAGAFDQPNVQNTTWQNVKISGILGNQFLIQTSAFAAKTRDASGNFVNAVAVTAGAGASGFSVAPGTPLWVNDFLRCADSVHASYGESVRVLAYDKASGTGTLALPFSHALGAVACLPIKSAYGLSWQNVIITNDFAGNGVQGQWGDALANFTVRQSTIVSQSSGLPTQNTSEFNLRNKKGTNATLATFGCEAFHAIDSIFEALSAEDGWPDEARVTNCRLRRITPLAKGNPVLDDGNVVVDAVVFDSHWRPTFAGGAQVLKGRSPMPWGCNSPDGEESRHGEHPEIGAVQF